MSQIQKTALHQAHLDANGKLVDFAGWEMPINYGSQIEEHHHVRQDAGMFDVSHMVVLDIQGADAKAFLQKLLANDVDKLKVPGKALYSGMLKPDGGVIDDLIVYYVSDGQYRMVVNAANRDKDIAWMENQIESFEASLSERDDLSIIAVQGPTARDKVLSVLEDEDAEDAKQLKPFFAVQLGNLFMARTGYTGEDGFEIILPNTSAMSLWKKLLAADVRPIGLGARDTLRLEAGMNLYGSDMDESTSPLVSNMAWTVAWQPETRDFNGRQALEAEKMTGVAHQLVGLVLNEKGVLRDGQTILTAKGQGKITSGSFSPTIGKSIALARIPMTDTDSCEVEIRGKRLSCRIVKVPFVRNGEVLV